jgi:photosystem II stability/assembly factor-like uncharacterized protein
MFCLSPGGPMIYAAEKPSNEMLVGTGGGVVRLRKESAGKWRAVAHALDGQHVSSLVLEPGSDTIFAGLSRGGVQASQDGGKTWQTRNNGLSERDVYSLNLARNGKGAKLYCGTEPAHVFESSDLGATWRDLAGIRNVGSVPKWNFPWPPHIAHVKDISFDPNDTKTIYISVEQGALLKSTDGGITWKDLEGFAKDVHRTVVCRTDPNRIYISTSAGVYRSTNGGDSWTRLIETKTGIGYPDPIIVHPRDENVVITAGSISTPGTWGKTHTADSRMFRSRDGGKSWERLTKGLPEHMRPNIEALAIEVTNGTSQLFAANTDGEIYGSDNDGDSWALVAEGLPPVGKFGHKQGLMG